MRSANMKRVFLGAALICAALSGGAEAADCPVAWDQLAAALKAQRQAGRRARQRRLRQPHVGERRRA